MKVNKVNLKDNEIGAKRDRVSNNFYKEITIIDPSKATDDNLGRSNGTVATFRFYWGSTVCHCVAWFFGKDQYGSGYGNAGGGGYCKESASMQAALEQAGIKLSKNIHGVGETAMREAAIAIGKKLSGKRKLYLHVAHQ
tara:strand:+ start:43 stop:459 length:417 start_codon:yes stop_codon:yes gene_type:complete